MTVAAVKYDLDTATCFEYIRRINQAIINDIIIPSSKCPLENDIMANKTELLMKRMNVGGGGEESTTWFA